MSTWRCPHRRFALAVLATTLLAGCSQIDFGIDENPPGTIPGDSAVAAPPPNAFDASALFDTDVESAEGVRIGVNTYLWRATIDTLSFLPLASADPFGGVVITDWYAPPEAPNERFKVTAYILDRTLRADGIRVAVFRQVQDRRGQWTDAPVQENLGTDLENTILTRARQLKIRTFAG